MLYGRHSSELQNPRSTADQIAALRLVAEARGLSVTGEFADEAVTGSDLRRPGIQALLACAASGGCDRVLAESLDRISRDQEGVAHVFKRLTFAGVHLETLSEGVVTELHVGLMGAMNQLFLRELARKTRRGLVARVKAGFSGGGRCYGYDRVDTGLGGSPGVLRVNVAEAAVIRRIFRDFAGGMSPRAIAAALNAEGVAGPRGGVWSHTTICGDRRVGDGLLSQELYVGVRLFNRRRFRRHPETGRRSSVINPAEAWVRVAVPELRLLSDRLWRAAQARFARVASRPAGQRASPKRLLSHIMVCGLCGGPMVLLGGRYGCKRARQDDACSNRRIITATIVESRVLAQLLAATPPAPAGVRTTQAVRDLHTLVAAVRTGSTARAWREDHAETTPQTSASRRRRVGGEAASATLDTLHTKEALARLRRLLGRVVFTPRQGRGAFALRIEGAETLCRAANSKGPERPASPLS